MGGRKETQRASETAKEGRLLDLHSDCNGVVVKMVKDYFNGVETY